MKLFNNYFKLLSISVICTILNGIFHAFFAPIHEYSPPSYFVENDIFKAAALFYMFTIFIFLGLVFMFIEKNLSGKKTEKGLRFGLSFGIIWFMGIIGMSLIINSPIMVELLVATFDLITLVLFGLLAGKFIATDNLNIIKEEKIINLLAIFIIGLVYVIGRYLAYVFFNIETAYATKLLISIIWTFGIGFSMGLMYLLLKQSVIYYSPIKKAIIFGLIIFGIDWFLFNLFPLLVIDTSFIDLLIFSMTDIILFILGIFSFEKIIKKN